MATNNESINLAQLPATEDDDLLNSELQNPKVNFNPPEISANSSSELISYATVLNDHQLGCSEDNEEDETSLQSASDSDLVRER